MVEIVKKLRVGVIGCGRVSVMHLGSIQLLDEVELVSCCDIKKERAEAMAKKYGVKAYSSYEEMIKNEKLNAVHIEETHQDEDTTEYEGGKDYWGFQHIRQIRQFYNAVLGKEPLEISGAKALRPHRLIMEIYKMGKAGMR